MRANFSPSMLVPDAWDPAWTQLSDGVFNIKPDALAPTLNTQNPNAVTTTTTAITGSAPSQGLALLTANPKRRLLILQNNSTATTAGDVAPTFYFAFSQQANAMGGIGLPPGVGLVLDVACPIDAVYLTIGPFDNAGGSVVITGAAVEGVTPPGI